MRTHQQETSLPLDRKACALSKYTDQEIAKQCFLKCLPLSVLHIVVMCSVLKLLGEKVRWRQTDFFTTGLLGAFNMLMSPVNPQERNIRCKISKT